MTQLDSTVTPKGEDPQTYAIIGAGMEVHTELGPGFLEAVYQEALAKELSLRGIPFVRETTIRVMYKGEPLSQGYRADFLCYGEIIVETKAMARMGPVEHAQAINYLKATGMKRALLMNFGASSLHYRRLVNAY